MRKVSLRRRPDGLLEVARVGHLRRAGIALGVMLMSVLVVLAVVAVLPALALTIPSLLLVGAYLGPLRLRNHAMEKLARVIPLGRRLSS